MQLHTIFNMKMQCNLFLLHLLLTCRQFQHLKYSVCPSVCTDDLLFTRKIWLILATCCLYCWTNHLKRTNHLTCLARLSINIAYIYWLKINKYVCLMIANSMKLIVVYIYKFKWWVSMTIYFWSNWPLVLIYF